MTPSAALAAQTLALWQADEPVVADDLDRRLPEARERGDRLPRPHTAGRAERRRRGEQGGHVERPREPDPPGVGPADGAAPDHPAAGAHVTAPVPTLAAAAEEAWEGIIAGFATECLVCEGTVRPQRSAGAGVVGGRCDRCGTELD